ncbi:MAG: tRNA (adenine(22)-N(1))-methyltransferase TrmK [Clostridia bacterium]|nr:tRNA (adenine(22)-N(1))-methyltransferase TrmK [Clostridia bacterium]
MAYSKRIRELCSLLCTTDTFADVGCDHGYCTEYMLKHGLCEHAWFSDVSKGSLAKAEALLGEYVLAGKATAVLGDGFFGVPASVGLVLIAGMGGSEIVSILSHKEHGFMPKRFVFQPMHDSEKLRRYILENGGYIERDYTFEDGKFYDVLVGRKRREGDPKNNYSALDYEFGQENIKTKPQAFCKKIRKLLRGVEEYLSGERLQEESKQELRTRKTKLQGVLQSEIK